MSKRFGRNQKRAMRAALVEAGIAAEKAQAECTAVNNYIRPMRQALDNVARVLGKHFVGLPPVERHVQAIQNRYRINQVRDIHDLSTFISNSEMAHMVNTAMHYLELEVGSMRSVVDGLRGMVHMRFRVGDREVAYGLSMSAIESLNTRDWEQELIQMVASEMAHYITSGRKS